MGVGCSMQQAFARAADVNLPERGDSALQWYRDEGRLRLLEVTADRIGELYQFSRPAKDTLSGEVYFSGLYFLGPNTTAYRIYERGFDAIYTNPERVDAQDIIFFKDDITGGVRGVSVFASALEDVNSRYQILKSTKDTMQQQSKIAAISSNNSGQPSELDYETLVNSEGAIEYVETMADGAVVKYQFNGDSYQVLKGEHPSDSFINGMRYLDASASLAVGFPYEFLFSGAQSGGAPFRGAFEAAGREILRLRNDVHRPRLDVISYVTIMDGVERKKLPPMPNIARGNWGFTTLPTADAFRDDQSDIKAIRAGITTKSAVIMANSGRSFPVVLRESMQEAIATAMAVEDANKTLVKNGYKPTVTVADIAQVSDNPQQAAAAEDMTLSQSPSNQLPDNSELERQPEALFEYGECERCEYCDESVASMEDDSEKRFEKVVTDPETGRERTVRYGQAGKAADGGDRIRPGTAKGDSYCARSEKIKGDWRSDPNSPNNLSRKKWNCRGPKSLAKLAFEESKHPRADDGKFGSGGGGAKADAPEPAKGGEKAESRNEPAAKGVEKYSAVENKSPSGLTFSQFDAVVTHLEKEHSNSISNKAAVENEIGASRDRMGLIDDESRKNPKWIEAKNIQQNAFNALREFNLKHSKHFKKETRAQIDKKRQDALAARKSLDGGSDSPATP